MILENKIYDVIRRMTSTLNTTQLQNLTGIKKITSTQNASYFYYKCRK